MSKKFTALSIAALKPKKFRYDIGDIETGLYIRVATSGTKTYVVRYKFLNKIRRLTLGRVEDIALGDARELTRDAMRKARSGINPAEEKQEGKQAKIKEERAKVEANLYLFEVAMETYIDLHVKSLKSGHEVIRMVNKDVIPFWKGRDITTITKSHVLELIRSIKAKGNHIYANRIFANVRAFFNWCVCNDYAGLQFSPCNGLKMPSKENKRDRVLSDEELHLVLLASDRMDEPWGDYFKLLMYTGVRRCEASAAQWSEFKLDGVKKEWIIPAIRSKNKRPLILPLPNSVVDLLKNMNRKYQSDYVFTTTGNTSVIGYSDAKERLDKHIEDILAENPNQNNWQSLDHWCIHDIRRSAATGMASLGIAPHIVEAVLNHVSGAMSGVAGIYNRHGYYQEKKQALELWANHLHKIRMGEPLKSNVLIFG